MFTILSSPFFLVCLHLCPVCFLSFYLFLSKIFKPKMCCIIARAAHFFSLNFSFFATSLALSKLSIVVFAHVNPCSFQSMHHDIPCYKILYHKEHHNVYIKCSCFPLILFHYLICFLNIAKHYSYNPSNQANSEIYSNSNCNTLQNYWISSLDLLSI